MPLQKIAPVGFGVWVWQLSHTEGGDIAKVIDRYKRCGVKWCLLKTGDTEPAWPANPMYKNWQGSAKALRDAGIGVYGWAYVSTIKPLEESRMLLDSVHQVDGRGDPLLRGMVLDPESEEERDGGHQIQMEETLTRFRQEEPDAFLGFAGWPVLSAHPLYPIKPLLTHCDLAMDQDYWPYQNVPPEWCLERAEIEFRKAKALHAPGSKCTRSPALTIHDVPGAEIERALADKSVGPSPSGWVHEYAKAEQWDAIANHTSGKTAPAPPPLVRVKEVQVFLNNHTPPYDCGAPDGVLGPQTRSAIARYQKDRGMPHTGSPDPVTLGRMRAELGWRP